MRDGTAQLLSALHVGLFRLTRGVIGRRLVDNDMLLLTTTGRASGHPHTVPLLYFEDGSDLIVIASWGGRPKNPDWYLNLVADPRVTVQVRRLGWKATATTMGSDERQTWWPRIVDAYEGYGEYQSRTDREIPVIRLKA